MEHPALCLISKIHERYTPYYIKNNQYGTLHNIIGNFCLNYLECLLIYEAPENNKKPHSITKSNNLKNKWTGSIGILKLKSYHINFKIKLANKRLHSNYSCGLKNKSMKRSANNWARVT